MKEFKGEPAWRLFLYTLLGTWVISATGKAIGDILHGSRQAPIAKVHVDAIRDTLDEVKKDSAASPVVVVQAPAHPGTTSVPAVAGADWESEIDALAVELGEAYGAPEGYGLVDGTDVADGAGDSAGVGGGDAWNTP